MATDATRTPGYSVGDVVETVEVMAGADLDLIRAWHANGVRPPQKGPRDFFGVAIGTRARVLERHDGFVRVELLGGSWKYRKVWFPDGDVRPLPTEESSAADVVDGLDLLARRHIYLEANLAGFRATAAAEARYPTSNPPVTGDAEVLRDYYQQGKTVYNWNREAGRRDVMARHAIDADHLRRIEAEGDARRWPVWDGLADKMGPIPTFGPAKLDARGRIVMSAEEKSQRRAAALRMLAILPTITDETDSDEVWSRLDPHLGGA